jgi:chorismate synthase
MGGNTTGKIFKLTTFGESHGPAIGGVIDGCPAGLNLDFAFIKREMDRRRPGQSRLVSPRKEIDEVEFLSGVFRGKTTGTPIGFLIRNEDVMSRDYDHIATAFRPGHADYTYYEKYGYRDYRGGGRSSARETACRVVGGAIAKLLLRKKRIKINAFTSSVAHISLNKPYTELDLSKTDANPIRCPHEPTAKKMINLIEKTRKAGDSLGGVISCVIKGVPPGIGEPVFDKLHAELGKAMLSINAVKGFEYGSGFAGTLLRGSKHNDEFYRDSGKKIRQKTNHAGGILGGISSGEDIYFRVAFKPVSTIMKDQNSVDETGNAMVLEGKGRHDPCVLPRAVPIVEAMSALVLADMMILAGEF